MKFHLQQNSYTVFTTNNIFCCLLLLLEFVTIIWIFEAGQESKTEKGKVRNCWRNNFFQHKNNNNKIYKNTKSLNNIQSCFDNNYSGKIVYEKKNKRKKSEQKPRQKLDPSYTYYTIREVYNLSLKSKMYGWTMHLNIKVYTRRYKSEERKKSTHSPAAHIQSHTI